MARSMERAATSPGTLRDPSCTGPKRPVRKPPRPGKPVTWPVKRARKNRETVTGAKPCRSREPRDDTLLGKLPLPQVDVHRCHPETLNRRGTARQGAGAGNIRHPHLPRGEKLLRETTTWTAAAASAQWRGKVFNLFWQLKGGCLIRHRKPIA